ncbi:hypothetical protein FGO68_gene5089 [Halteria grandinella]|uniref:HVA22-like protein n=1 Tax=Halteria grandinella TaxID=5974 RepID=A0A8J8NT75_HALGN|nr:hypothetical protein FGO68_gene5089 [Halteria grandinella]
MDTDFYHFVLDLILIAASVGYPVFQSFALLEIKRFDKSLVQWLAYWIIYSVLFKLESILLYYASDILNESLIYKLIKLMSILWLIHPDTLGALYLYTKTLDAIYEKHKDAALINLSTCVNKLSGLCNMLIDKIQPQAVEASKQVQKGAVEANGGGPVVIMNSQQLKKQMMQRVNVPAGYSTFSVGEESKQ